MIFLVYYIVSLSDCIFSFPQALRDIYPTTMAWYSLFLLKVPLNTKQTKNLCWCGSTKGIQSIEYWMFAILVTTMIWLELCTSTLAPLPA